MLSPASWWRASWIWCWATISPPRWPSPSSNKAGLTQVFDREKIALVLDHYTPCKDIKASRLCAQVREFAKRFDITHFYDVGCMGVEHALLPEQGS